MAKEKSTQWLTASWHGAFPAEDAKVVVQFMWDTWELLRTKHPKGINYKTKNEPKITTFYCGVLQSFAQAKGIYGKFDYETPHGKPNLETGEMEDRIRTDIRYLFPIQDSDNSHEIIFEFKILKNTNDSRKAYYQKNGMHRFISGDYSKKWDFAYMVGILTNDGRTAVKELKKVLQRNDLANGTLHIRRSEKTNLLIREPSEYMPDLAEFDTEHSRTLYGNLADLLLCHFFLDPPRATEK